MSELSSSNGYAEKFLQLMTIGMPHPEQSLDGDGEILLEWDYGRRQNFTVSIRQDGTLSFAGIFGQMTIHGTVPFQEPLPWVISECIQQVGNQ